ncbi:MAG: hypothetical protein FWD27_01345 [Coriobacteriia bacterium]|nr:hypothetical protein [Coriobacteriia bacterium]
MIPKIPVNMKALAKAGQLFEDASQAETLIEVLVDTSASAGLISLCRKVLTIQPGAARLTVVGFCSEMPPLNREADLSILVAGSSPLLKRIMEIALWSRHDCVVLSENAPALVATVPEEDALEIARTIIEVDLANPQEILEDRLAKWCINRLPQLRIALATALPFMRYPVSMDLTRQTAFENTAIAAIFFLPGADLPILTLNQCKLFYQIAVIHQVPLSRERLVELAAVIASAFGMRGLTRLAVRKLSPVSWLVRGTTAFGGTMALGRLAYELYSRGGGVVELAKGGFNLGSASDAKQEQAGQS